MCNINLGDIKAFIDLIHPMGEVFEIRLIGDKTYSGYFNNVDVAISELQKNEWLLNTHNCYITLNPILMAAHARTQANRIMQVRGGMRTTADNDMQCRRWVLLDIDGKGKIAGVNATEEEKEYNHKFAQTLYRELKRRGFKISLVTDSGNGYHLFLPIDTTNDKEHDTMVKDFLSALNTYISVSEKFGDLYLHSEIDLKVYNASRVVKLSGTYSRKGADDVQRPQRIAKILASYKDIGFNDIDKFKEFSDEFKLDVEQKPQTQYSNRNCYFNNGRFDMEQFIATHGIKISHVKELSWGKGYVLEECLFDSSHKRDAMLTQSNEGAVGYFCFHNSCSGNHWAEVKRLFKIENDNVYYRNYRPIQQRMSINVVIPKNPTNQPKSEPKQWYQLHEIEEEDWANTMFIPTGIKSFDKATGGLKEHEITALTATTGSGKTNLMLQISLNAADNGYKVGVFSGEQTNSEIASWMYRIAAGRVNTYDKMIGDYVSYRVYDGAKNKIRDWAKGKIFLYNSDFRDKSSESRVNTILEGIVEKVRSENLSLVCLDNLMVLDSEFSMYEKYNGQKELIFKLEELVKEYKLHIILIAHPRKTFNYLTINDIAGSSDIANTAQNVLIFHRISDHWKRVAKEQLPEDVQADIERNQSSSMLEIAKNRSRGRRDVYIPMHFDPICKRFTEKENEVITFGYENKGQAAPTNTSFTGFDMTDLSINPSFYEDNEEEPF